MPAAAAVDDDPYHGIVPNPNRKRNPWVLVGEWERRGGGGGDCVGALRNTFFFWPTPTSFFSHTGAAATGGVLAVGLIAFRNVSLDVRGERRS